MKSVLVGLVGQSKLYYVLDGPARQYDALLVHADGTSSKHSFLDFFDDELDIKKMNHTRFHDFLWSRSHSDWVGVVVLKNITVNSSMLDNVIINDDPLGRRSTLSFTANRALDFKISLSSQTIEQKALRRIGGGLRRAVTPKRRTVGRAIGRLRRAIDGELDPRLRRDSDGDGFIFDGTWREMPDPSRAITSPVGRGFRSQRRAVEMQIFPPGNPVVDNLSDFFDAARAYYEYREGIMSDFTRLPAWVRKIHNASLRPENTNNPNYIDAEFEAVFRRILHIRVERLFSTLSALSIEASDGTRRPNNSNRRTFRDIAREISNVVVSVVLPNVTSKDLQANKEKNQTQIFSILGVPVPKTVGEAQAILRQFHPDLVTDLSDTEAPIIFAGSIGENVDVSRITEGTTFWFLLNKDENTELTDSDLSVLAAHLEMMHEKPGAEQFAYHYKSSTDDYYLARELFSTLDGRNLFDITTGQELSPEGQKEYLGHVGKGAKQYSQFLLLKLLDTISRKQDEIEQSVRSVTLDNVEQWKFSDTGITKELLIDAITDTWPKWIPRTVADKFVTEFLKQIDDGFSPTRMTKEDKFQILTNPIDPDTRLHGLLTYLGTKYRMALMDRQSRAVASLFQVDADLTELSESISGLNDFVQELVGSANPSSLGFVQDLDDVDGTFSDWSIASFGFEGNKNSGRKPLYIIGLRSDKDKMLRRTTRNLMGIHEQDGTPISVGVMLNMDNKVEKKLLFAFAMNYRGSNEPLRELKTALRRKLEKLNKWVKTKREKLSSSKESTSALSIEAEQRWKNYVEREIERFIPQIEAILARGGKSREEGEADVENFYKLFMQVTALHENGHLRQRTQASIEMREKVLNTAVARILDLNSNVSLTQEDEQEKQFLEEVLQLNNNSGKWEMRPGLDIKRSLGIWYLGHSLVHGPIDQHIARWTQTAEIAASENLNEAIDAVGIISVGLSDDAAKKIVKYGMSGTLLATRLFSIDGMLDLLQPFSQNAAAAEMIRELRDIQTDIISKGRRLGNIKLIVDGKPIQITKETKEKFDTQKRVALEAINLMLGELVELDAIQQTHPDVYQINKELKEGLEQMKKFIDKLNVEEREATLSDLWNIAMLEHQKKTFGALFGSQYDKEPRSPLSINPETQWFMSETQSPSDMAVIRDLNRRIIGMQGYLYPIQPRLLVQTLMHEGVPGYFSETEDKLIRKSLTELGLIMGMQLADKPHRQRQRTSAIDFLVPGPDDAKRFDYIVATVMEQVVPDPLPEGVTVKELFEKTLRAVDPSTQAYQRLLQAMRQQANNPLQNLSDDAIKAFIRENEQFIVKHIREKLIPKVMNSRMMENLAETMDILDRERNIDVDVSAAQLDSTKPKPSSLVAIIESLSGASERSGYLEFGKIKQLLQQLGLYEKAGKSSISEFFESLTATERTELLKGIRTIIIETLSPTRQANGWQKRLKMNYLINASLFTGFMNDELTAEEVGRLRTVAQKMLGLNHDYTYATYKYSQAAVGDQGLFASLMALGPMSERAEFWSEWYAAYKAGLAGSILSSDLEERDIKILLKTLNWLTRPPSELQVSTDTPDAGAVDTSGGSQR